MKGHAARMLRQKQPPPKPSTESGFKKPVAWLLGRQLIASLKGVVLLAIYGGKLDPRDWMRANIFSARGTDNQQLVESTDPAEVPGAQDPADGEFWFDYIADSGDGQLATYSIAYLCFSDLWAAGSYPKPRSKITFEPEHGTGPAAKQDEVAVTPGGNESLPREGPCRLRRGSFLLVGGDTAYHTADYQSLARRFWNPFRWAASDKGMNDKSERRPLFGIPGNHDYYDAIDGFNRQFRLPTSKEGEPNLEGLPPQLSIPGFERRQTASYLAVRMPFDWWLWAVDSEVEHVDIRQQEFFKKLQKEYGIKKLIVATSEPTTVLGQQSTGDNVKTATVFKRLGLRQAFFLRPGQTQKEKSEYELHPGTCRVDLSGDTHHYARYWGPPVEKTSPSHENATANYVSVVAGMGGAFMHPSQTDTGGIPAVVKYPAPKDSRKAVIRELLRVTNIILGGFIWLIGAVIAGLITFAAIRVPSSRAAVDAVLGNLPGVTADRLDQRSGLFHIEDPGASARAERDRDRGANIEGLFHSLLLWGSLAGAAVLIYFAAHWPRRVFERARDEMVDSTDYWGVWVLLVAAAAVVAFGLWMWGRDHSAARVLSDLVFITLVILVPGGAAYAAWAIGAELLGKTGRFLFALLGLWHGAVQLTLPFLFVRLGGPYSIAATAITLVIAAALGVLCSRLFPEVARGMDWKFGLALLGLWVIATLAIIATTLYLPGPPLRYLPPGSGGWGLALLVLEAAIIGLLMSCVSLGWYMAVSVSFNGHNNEAGGAARVEAFKQMVRFRITQEELTGFVIGFDRPRMDGKDLEKELKLVDVFRIRR